MNTSAKCGALRRLRPQVQREQSDQVNHSLLLSLSILIVKIGPTQDGYNVVMAIEIELESWIPFSRLMFDLDHFSLRFLLKEICEI